jgi:hypothetical protein
MLVRYALCACVLLVGASRSVSGQQLSPSRFPARAASDLTVGLTGDRLYVLTSHAAPLAPLKADSAHRDYRWEGLIIGALALGVGGALAANGLCHDDSSDKDCTGSIVGYFLVGATVGGVTGGLIGAAIPKD